jgi:hypothetical protein
MSIKTGCTASHYLNQLNYRIENIINIKKVIKNAILKSRSFFYAIRKNININILKDIKTENYKSRKKTTMTRNLTMRKQQKIIS